MTQGREAGGLYPARLSGQPGVGVMRRNVPAGADVQKTMSIPIDRAKCPAKRGEIRPLRARPSHPTHS
jgi:hypothetical protein